MQVYGLRFFNFFRFGEKDNSVVFDISPENQELLDKGKITLDEIYDQLSKNPITYIKEAQQRGLTNLIGIAGIMGDDYDFSNGVGKSTILEAICYAHYDQVVRRNVNTDKIATAGLSVVTKINGKYPPKMKESWVEEIFEEGGKVYRIKRGRSFSGTHQSSSPILEFSCCNDNSDEDDSQSGHRKADTHESIAKATPMDYETFINSVMFAQSDAGKFLQGTDKIRKDMLVSLLKLEDVIAGCLDNIRKRKNLKDKEITTLNAQIDVVDSNLKARETVETIETKIKDCQDKITTTETEIRGNNDKIEELSKSDLIKAIDAIKEEGKKTKESLASLKETKETQVKEWRNLYTECEKKEVAQQAKIDAIVKRRASIDHEILTLEDSIKNFNLADREEELKKVEKAREVKPKLVEASKKAQEEREKILGEIASSESEHNRLINSITSLKSQMANVKGDDFVCDKCKSKVSRAHIDNEINTITENAKKIVSNLVVLKNSKQEVTEKLTKVQANLDKANEYLIKENKIKAEISANNNSKQKLEETRKLQNDDYGKMHSDMKEEQRTIQKQKAEYQTKSNEVSQKYDKDILALQNSLDALALKYTTAKKNAEELDLKITALKNEVTRLTQGKSQYDSQIGSLKNDIEAIKKDSLKLKNLRDKQAEEVAILNRLITLEDVFGLDGIQTRIVKKYLPLLNIYIKEMMDVLTHGDMKVEVFINDKSKIDISIIGGMADNFTMISGGEKMLVRLAVDIGLALLSFTRCAERPQLICLDEVFDPLDSHHTEGVFKLISKLQERFNRVLVISHKENVNKIIKHQILIEKGTGIFGMSRVRSIT